MISIAIDEQLINDKDLVEKLASVATALQDLFDWIVIHKEDLTIESFWSPEYQNPLVIHNSNQMLTRLKDVLTKSAANINGYHKELFLADKHIRKNRKIHFGSRGDLAVDYDLGNNPLASPYGKAIQSKSCYSAAYGDVDEHIKKAALQLTGEKLPAETPSNSDRRIVDISIKNSLNTWPKTTADKSPLTLNDIVARITKYVTEYAQGKKGYNKWSELTPQLGQKNTLTQFGRINSRPGWGEIDLVVKIRWSHPRKVTDSNKAITYNVTAVTVRVDVTNKQGNNITVNGYVVRFLHQ
ncbi:MAG: hypothetical protein WC782_08520 [Methylococcaceae bacterium]|jgi:hypothetical protein